MINAIATGRFKNYRKICEYLYELMEIAKGGWNYIRNGIEEMNDNSRCGKALDDFKSRVLNAKDGNDSI